METPRIVLGISGGIAAYKAADIVRGLVKEGAAVTVVMTKHACEFITPLTLATLSGRRVITSAFDPSVYPDDETDVEHIQLASRCDLLLVAPATANVIGKMSNGIADDFLSTFYLAVTCPVLVAPAMNTSMWEHPAVVANLEVLRTRGVRFIDPEYGDLASRTEGKGVGRLAAPERIAERALAIARAELEKGRAGRGDRSLEGNTVLVSAGPTRERLDAVRYLSSPSSGKMGFAMAEAARDMGARVILVTGPTQLHDPPGIEIRRVTTAEEMRARIMEYLDGASIVIKAAAVADFRPTRPESGKPKKERAPRSIDLEPTPDILAEIGAAGGGRFLVGFAAETEDLLANARTKLEAKRLDLIVANDVGAEGIGFESDMNAVTVIDRTGHEERWPSMSKSDLARRLMSLIAEKVG